MVPNILKENLVSERIMKEDCYIDLCVLKDKAVEKKGGKSLVL